MNLLIDRDYDYEFVIMLRDKFIRDITLKLSLNDFTKIDVELNSMFQFPETTLSKEIIIFALDNLRIIKRSRHYSLEFDSTINYPNTRIKLITLLQFISYGNFNVQGNSILINEFEELNKNLITLYEIYKARGVVI